jgi:hypothetical protein
MWLSKARVLVNVYAGPGRLFHEAGTRLVHIQVVISLYVHAYRGPGP